MHTTLTIQLETLVVRSPDQVSGALDGETVMLSVENGEYYKMNGAGSRVWDLLATPIAVSALVDQLLREFSGERATVEKDVLDYLRQLQTDGLVQASPGPSRPAG